MLFNSLNYMTYAFKCINLISYMLIWAVFDCRHKLDQLGVRYHKLEGVKKKKKKRCKLMFEKKKKNKAQSPQAHTLLSNHITLDHSSKRAPN